MTHTDSYRLEPERLEGLVRARHVSQLDRQALAGLVRAELDPGAALPDGTCAVDPRTGDLIVHTAARARRPHDNRPQEAAQSAAPSQAAPRACPICEGRTTGAVDVAPLPVSGSQTFINENLFPVLYPWSGSASGALGAEGRMDGLHFLQWTSTVHDRDWHNLPPADCAVVMDRLAALEGALLAGAPAEPGWVLILKNYGHGVGASLSHGHQQVLWSSRLPRRLADNARFERERGETVARYLLRETPAELTLVDYGPALLVVPAFMRRPYDMVLLVKDTRKAHLSELDEDELDAVAHGWHDAIRAMHQALRVMNREIAYNVVTNNGPGAGLCFEFLPYTQEIGGLEHLGLYVCQESPASAAAGLRQFLSDNKTFDVGQTSQILKA